MENYTNYEDTTKMLRDNCSRGRGISPCRLKLDQYVSAGGVAYIVVKDNGIVVKDDGTGLSVFAVVWHDDGRNNPR